MCRSLILGAGMWLAAVTGVGAQPPGKADSEVSTAPQAGSPYAQAGGTAEPLPPLPTVSHQSAPIPGPGASGIDMILGTPTGCDCQYGTTGQASCGPPGRVWTSAEFLWWFPRGFDAPP